MNFELITLTVSDHVAHLVLNRPERLNALDKTSLGEINRAMDLAEADAEDRKSTRLNSSHLRLSRMPSSA